MKDCKPLNKCDTRCFKNEDDLFLNSGDGEWDASFSPFFQSATQDVVPGYYNNDGRLDVFAPGLQMIGGNNGPKYTSLLYKNTSPEEGTSSNNHYNAISNATITFGGGNDIE